MIDISGDLKLIYLFKITSLVTVVVIKLFSNAHNKFKDGFENNIGE